MAIITISRGTHSGGDALAMCLAEKLGYQTLSREELLTEAAGRFGAKEDELQKALEHKPGFLHSKLHAIHYIAYIRFALLKKAAECDLNLIYHGHAGHLLISDAPNLLRVKVIADMEYRIKELMKRKQLTRKEAGEYILARGSERDKWAKTMYGTERHDATAYDLVINIGKMTVDTACEIVSLAVKKGLQVTPESQKAIKDLVLAAKVTAQIATIKKLNDSKIEITANDGVITIGGTLRSINDADKVRACIRDIEEVNDIKSEEHIVDYSYN